MVAGNQKSFNTRSWTSLQFVSLLLSIHLLLLPVLLVVTAQNSENEQKQQIHCNPQWCEDAQVRCSEIAPNCTKIGFRTMKSPETCNCCEYCFDYLVENQDCPTQISSPPEHMCGPSLECSTFRDEDYLWQEQCKPMDRDPPSCNSELRAYNKATEEGGLGVAQFKPECDAHGDYAPRQCLPASICYCSNKQGGRIFGAGTLSSRMNCACARDYALLRSFGLEGTFPHCLPNGNYDELQCSLRTRACYCISKPEKSVPIQMWNTLPCYDSNLHGDTYLRPCELRVAEIKIQVGEAEIASKAIYHADIPQCDPDGSYHPVQSMDQYWACVDGNGNPLVDDENGNREYMVEKTGLTPEHMNCNCARARHLISNSNNKPKCCQNGNYRDWQCTGSTCYCVDSNTGKQDMHHAEVHVDDVSSLGCYATSC